MVKGQVLTNFVAEFSPKNEGEIVCHVECRLWKAFMDGASSAMGVDAGIVVITSEGIRLKHSFRLGFGPLTTKLSTKPCFSSYGQFWEWVLGM